MPDYVSIGWSSENQLSPECCFEPVTTRHSHSIQYYYRSTRPITWKKHGYYTELGIANITSDEIIPYLSLGHYTILLACGAFADFPLELITNYLGSVLIGFLDLSQINIYWVKDTLYPRYPTPLHPCNSNWLGPQDFVQIMEGVDFIKKQCYFIILEINNLFELGGIWIRGGSN